MLLESCWTALVHFFSFQSLFSSQQYPLPPDGGVEYPASPTAAAELAEPSDALTFKPIGASDTFECVYPGLKNKYDAIPGGNQKIWLQPKQGTSNLQRYDINTNYETTTPQGKVRDVWLDATQLDKDHPAMPDGEEYIVGNYFNNTYPGHRIEACWGDTVRVHVTNKLKHNGTAIHMHGIRMLDTNLADGVPGVTQCPIAPGDTFTYEFKAVQYGTTWYHSHYSLQYTDSIALSVIVLYCTTNPLSKINIFSDIQACLALACFLCIEHACNTPCSASLNVLVAIGSVVGITVLRKPSTS